MPARMSVGMEARTQAHVQEQRAQLWNESMGQMGYLC